jgi:hypothetical protein
MGCSDTNGTYLSRKPALDVIGSPEEAQRIPGRFRNLRHNPEYAALLPGYSWHK